MRFHPALFASLAAQAVRGAAVSNITCSSGLFMIVARGSLEDPGTGKIGVVAGNVSEAIPHSTILAVEYPATFADYTGSEGTGVTAMTTWIEAYVAACPDGKIALLGYSQGGQVTTDTLCGRHEPPLFNVSTALATPYKKNVLAAITFGDPTHKVGASFNVGTSKKDGIFPRQNLSSCDPYADRLRSWCDSGDRYCDSGNNTATHSTYFKNYTEDAVDFIVKKYKESKASESSSTSTSPISLPTASATTAVGNASAHLAAPTLIYQAFLALLVLSSLL